MEAQKLHRGRLIDHIQLVVRDLESSKRFYSAVFEVLGIDLVETEHGFFYADELVVSSADSEASEGRLTGRVHLAFQAKDREQVQAVYDAALANGGTDHGAPGERQQYHPGYFAGYFLDPDGSNIEAVYHGEADRSADSIEINFKQ
ncbi:VOC family protein [Sphingomonas sp. LY29]|uniref:VOC family protein n=1 Tax=Sphingomonas sp. LY29 TaxID=3095341 RepID=UPI002D797E02|nr:VOC family protein [Sphingomonas sp. LY29]WRP26667.1 VOC family protein [Sphingomonas sp. LY29]